MPLLSPRPRSRAKASGRRSRCSQQGPAWVKAQGFGLPLDRLWDEKAGGGLLANAVQLPGCSGSFISAEGLLITNHHCVVGILQEHSTPQANLSQDGYLARTRADEKKAGAFRIQVPRAFRDVTQEVLAAVPAGRRPTCALRGGRGAAEGPRRRVREEARHALPVRGVRRRPVLHADRVRGDQGRPARLRAARGVGNFGGEIDNWSWPRHTGDFSLLRAYKDGQPYRPRYFFPVSTEGVKRGRRRGGARLPGPLVPLVDRRRDEGARGALVPGRRATSTPSGSGSWTRRRRARPRRRSRRSTTCAGSRTRGRTPRARSRACGAGGSSRSSGRPTSACSRGRRSGRTASPPLEAHEGLARLNAERLGTWDRDFLLDMTSRGPRGLRWPLSLARRATEGDEARRASASRDTWSATSRGCATSSSATRSATPRPRTGGSSARG